MDNVWIGALTFITLLSCGDRESETIDVVEKEIVLASDTTLYYPPIGSDEWETLSADSLGWSVEGQSSLDAFVESSDTRALLILKNGRIVYEKYQGKNLTEIRDFTATTLWYWASAGKTLTAYMTGRAEAEGLLSLDDASTKYLGTGWTSLSTQQEQQITIWHQLTMTSGLDYRVSDLNCVQPACLTYLNEPGAQWYYHNGPYKLLADVIADASGKDWSEYFNEQLRDKIGMNGFWDRSGERLTYYSTARSMARFGLLILSKGTWEGEDILENDDYFHQMVNTSQKLNHSYGYLWWLNGKGSFVPPGITLSIARDITPSAPATMIAAMGKNGQLINIVPEQNLIIIRMGNDPYDDQGLVSVSLQEELWVVLNKYIQD